MRSEKIYSLRDITPQAFLFPRANLLIPLLCGMIQRMKLLIIKSKKTNPHPHLWKDAYIEKIKDINVDIEIVVTSDEEEILRNIS